MNRLERLSALLRLWSLWRRNGPARERATVRRLTGGPHARSVCGLVLRRMVEQPSRMSVDEPDIDEELLERVDRLLAVMPAWVRQYIEVEYLHCVGKTQEHKAHVMQVTQGRYSRRLGRAHVVLLRHVDDEGIFLP